MFIRSTNTIFLVFFIFSVFVFLFHYYFVGQAVYGDGIYYYAYTRSLYKDHDLNFRNEFGHHYSKQNNNATHEEPLGVIPRPTKTGFIPNKYPIGVSLSWIPGFLIADMITQIVHLFIPRISTLGYSNMYQIPIGILNILYVNLGLFTLYKFLTKIYKPPIPFLTIFTVFFGSNLIYYGSWDVINSHSLSFLLGSFFIYLWWKTRKLRTIKEWTFLGLLLGCITLTRTQDFVFIFFPLVDAILLLKKTRSIKYISLLFFTMLGFILVFSIQFFVWKIIYGSYFVSPYLLSSERFTFSNPHFLGVLFNIKTGLILWTPFYLISFFAIFWIKNKILRYYSASFIVLQFILISSWSGWSQGESFGIRMFISTLPLFAVGFGRVLDVIHKKKKMLPILLSIVLTFYTIIAIVIFLVLLHSPTYDKDKNTQLPFIKNIQKVIHQYL